MKFRCERDVFLDAVATAGRAVSARSSLPVLAGLRLTLNGDQLSVVGSDLDLTVVVDVEVAGAGDGMCVIPAKLLGDVIRSLEPGAVEFELAAGEAQITAGRSQFALRTIPAEEYPKVAEVTAAPVELDAAVLGRALKQVVRAASSDDSRPILTGVLMAAEEGGLRLVATDSYRLSVCDLPSTAVLAEGQSILVPSRALGELGRLLGGDDHVQLRLGDRDASFTVGGVRLMTRLIEGAFPNYQGLIPSNYPNQLTTGREHLLEAVRRVRLMAQEATPLRMSMAPGTLELIAMTQDVGQAHESVDADYDGEELTVAFNPEYLMDGIEVTPGDEVLLETVDALKPALLRSPGHPEFLYLLMPVRVS